MMQSLSPLSREMLIDCAAIPTAVAFLGKRVVTTLSTPALAVGGALNAAMVAGVDYLSHHDQDLLEKVAMTIGALSLGVLFLPKFSHWAGYTISIQEACYMAGVAGATKAIAWILENIVWVRDVKIAEDALALHNFQMRFVHKRFQNDLSAFQALGLRTQVILNQRFLENGYETLQLKGLSSFSSDFTREELLSLTSYLDLSSLSTQEKQKLILALYQRDIFLTGETFQREDLKLIRPVIKLSGKSNSAEKAAWAGMVRTSDWVKECESLKKQHDVHVIDRKRRQKMGVCLMLLWSTAAFYMGVQVGVFKESCKYEKVLGALYELMSLNKEVTETMRKVLKNSTSIFLSEIVSSLKQLG